MAWSHTVSTAYRFTPYQLTLVPGSPTQYLQDGTPVDMTSRKVTVQVRQDDGSVKPLTRTLWSTRYGPMINSLVGVPLPWTPAAAFTYRDANANNFRSFNHFFATNRAQSVAAELKILRKYQGIPWVNTIVADRTGHALYADIGAIPNVPDALAQQCDSGLGIATSQLLGLPVLDGSRTAASRTLGSVAGRCSTVRAPRATGRRPPTPPRPGSSARATCRCSSARTSSRTPTTRSGCRTPSIPSRASRGSSATSARRGRCVHASG